MTLEEFKERIIDDGIAEVTECYADNDVKREGAIEGFEIARSLDTREAFEKVIRHRLHREAGMRHAGPDRNELDRYWRSRWATLQLEWVLDCLKVAAWAQPGEMLSGRAARKTVEVLS